LFGKILFSLIVLASGKHLFQNSILLGIFFIAVSTLHRIKLKGFNQSNLNPLPFWF
jgi:hypothetical protein